MSINNKLISDSSRDQTEWCDDDIARDISTWRVPGPDHRQLPLLRPDPLEYRARPDGDLPAGAALVGGGRVGEVVGGRGGSRERDSPDSLS